MFSRDVTVVNQLGLHARARVGCARRHQELVVRRERAGERARRRTVDDLGTKRLGAPEPGETLGLELLPSGRVLHRGDRL